MSKYIIENELLQNALAEYTNSQRHFGSGQTIRGFKFTISSQHAEKYYESEEEAFQAIVANECIQYLEYRVHSSQLPKPDMNRSAICEYVQSKKRDEMQLAFHEHPQGWYSVEYCTYQYPPRGVIEQAIIEVLP
jgi:hypothetical protein